MTNIMKKNLKRAPVIVKSEEDILPIMNTVGSGAICPIFSISAVTGEGIDVLRKFLYLLPMSNVRN